MNAIQIVKDIMTRYYVTKEIKNREDLLEVCTKELTINQFNNLVELLVEELDSDLVSDVLVIGFILNYFNKKNESGLRQLIKLDFHQSHEDIVSLFQLKYNNNLTNIPVLFNAVNNIPEYLRPDDFKYPYIRKVIYAIGAQQEPYNIQSLEELAKYEDEKIRNLALHQIEKRKKLGRWEFKENAE